MLLIIREALLGTTRFVEFQTSLGIAPDMLSSRLATLVDYAVMIKRAYQEPGQRARPEYHLTPAGRELRVVIAALQQWGDRHLNVKHQPRSFTGRIRTCDTGFRRACKPSQSWSRKVF